MRRSLQDIAWLSVPELAMTTLTPTIIWQISFHSVAAVIFDPVSAVFGSTCAPSVASSNATSHAAALSLFTSLKQLVVSEKKLRHTQKTKIKSG